MISLDGVDWSGRLVGRCGFNFKPVPVINQDSTIYSSLIYWSKVLQELLLPAKPEDVFAELGRLKLHFPGVVMEERENEILIQDYVIELSIFPIDLIKLVCREYRLDGSNKFFPKLGQLYTMTIPHFSARISKSNKLLALIEASENNSTL